MKKPGAVRYVVTEDAPMSNGQRVFNVGQSNLPEYKKRQVWGDEQPRCTVCSGSLTAMLANCPHTNAVRRYLKRKKS